MTVKLSSVRANLEVEAKGEWIDYPELPGVSFMVSSLHAPAYKLARDNLLQRLTRQYKGKPVPESVLVPETAKLYCKHILHGWKGFDEDYTPEKALETLSDPGFRKVIEAVEWCASRVGERDIEFEEKTAKNSEAPSRGE
ncbi:MAG TPA: hypothetical protein VMF90_15010 [Rhizobiaceae bacterium]|nr:hypothetical protein [Rhizobiaceae bacterium]